MFKCGAEYYTNVEPITHYEFRAWTKTGALKKAFDFKDKVNNMNLGKVQYTQVWFRHTKIFGDGNCFLFGRSQEEILWKKPLF